MRYVAAIIPAIFIGLLLSVQAQAGYLVTLHNGQTLEAETFNIENSRITLKYKVGEVSFPMSMVKSVTDDNGQGDFLSGPAPQVVKPAAPQAPPAQAQQPARPWQPQQPPPVQQAAPQAVQPPPQSGLPGVTGDDEDEDLNDEDNNNDDSNDLPPDEGEQ